MSADADPANLDREELRRSALEAEKTRRAPERLAGNIQGVDYPYGVPRRFDLATLFTVTIAYALLFWSVQAIRAPAIPRGFSPLFIAMLGGFVTCVGLAQSLLFRGQSPRAASAVVGIVLMVALFVVGDWNNGNRNPASLIGSVPVGVAFGAFSGYVTGGAVAGVFLIADAIRRRLPRREQPANADESDDPLA